MSRDIPFDENAVCESCCKMGAYDFMGYELCVECAFPDRKSTGEKSDSKAITDARVKS